MGIDNENLEMVELLLENKVVTSTMIIMITIMMITITVIIHNYYDKDGGIRLT